jgi:hypothetical protein
MPGPAWTKAQKSGVRRQRETPEPLVKRCSFCRKPRSEVEVLIGDDFTFICDGCIPEAARLVAERKAKPPTEA